MVGYKASPGSAQGSENLLEPQDNAAPFLFYIVQCSPQSPRTPSSIPCHLPRQAGRLTWNPGAGPSPLPPHLHCPRVFPIRRPEASTWDPWILTLGEPVTHRAQADSENSMLEGGTNTKIKFCRVGQHRKSVVMWR